MVRNNLAELRGGKHQEEVASDLGFSRATMSALENGRKAPKLDTIQRLLTYYGKPLIFDLSPDEKSPKNLSDNAN